MVLDNHRSKADGVLVPIASKFINTNPDHISAVAIFLAFIAGVMFYFVNQWEWMLLAASRACVGSHVDREHH